MGSMVWMGVRGAERWFRAPAPRTSFQPTGWSAMSQGRNGRAVGRRSRATHMEYDLAWNSVSTDDARVLTDMFYGVDATNLDELIHWLDPMVKKNVLPVHWSFPGLSVTDGPIIGSVQRPTAVVTAANSKNLPKVSARFTGNGIPGPMCYIPIPPGYAAHVGVHYATAAAANSVVVAHSLNGSISAGPSAIILPGIGPSDATRFTTVIPRTGNMTGIGLRIQPGTSVNGTVLPNDGAIAGMMVEVLPVGQSPVGQGWVSGEGNSGCRMFEPPTKTPISAYRDRVSVGARLIEVGP